MKYPKSPCISDLDMVKSVETAKCVRSDSDSDCHCGEKEALLMQISQIQFAAIDLNLYLDTHPHDQEALTLFKKLSNTYRSLVCDYEAAYGPLTAGSASANAPFTWVAPDQKWPWQK
ncbi:MAG: spore coat protein CotJB [Ruminococcaceae bacterium]|nr:spore coat protein CotJB [Oscillospiraceae bacterium]